MAISCNSNDFVCDIVGQLPKCAADPWKYL